MKKIFWVPVFWLLEQLQDRELSGEEMAEMAEYNPVIIQLMENIKNRNIDLLEKRKVS